MTSILCALDLSTLGFSDITNTLIVLFIIWQVIKNLRDMSDTSTKVMKRREGWDNAARVIAEKEHKWDEGLTDIYAERNAIVKQYNGRLDDQDAKIQQLVSMQCMTLRAQEAILEALVEQGIGNGEIKSMHKELKDFILDQVQ